MAVNWEARRRHIKSWQGTVKEAVALYDARVAAHGPLSESEAVALLVAQVPAIKDEGEARNAIRYFPQARRGFHA